MHKVDFLKLTKSKQNELFTREINNATTFKLNHNVLIQLMKVLEKANSSSEFVLLYKLIQQCLENSDIFLNENNYIFPSYIKALYFIVSDFMKKERISESIGITQYIMELYDDKQKSPYFTKLFNLFIEHYKNNNDICLLKNYIKLFSKCSNSYYLVSFLSFLYEMDINITENETIYYKIFSFLITNIQFSLSDKYTNKFDSIIFLLSKYYIHCYKNKKKSKIKQIEELLFNKKINFEIWTIFRISVFLLNNLINSEENNLSMNAIDEGISLIQNNNLTHKNNEYLFISYKRALIVFSTTIETLENIQPKNMIILMSKVYTILGLMSNYIILQNSNCDKTINLAADAYSIVLQFSSEIFQKEKFTNITILNEFIRNSFTVIQCLQKMNHPKWKSHSERNEYYLDKLAKGLTRNNVKNAYEIYLNLCKGLFSIKYFSSNYNYLLSKIKESLMETENYLTYFIILFISFLISSYKDSYIFIQWSLYKSKLEGKNTFLYEEFNSFILLKNNLKEIKEFYPNVDEEPININEILINEAESYLSARLNCLPICTLLSKITSESREINFRIQLYFLKSIWYTGDLKTIEKIFNFSNIGLNKNYSSPIKEILDFWMYFAKYKIKYYKIEIKIKSSPDSFYFNRKGNIENFTQFSLENEKKLINEFIKIKDIQIDMLKKGTEEFLISQILKNIELLGSIFLLHGFYELALTTWCEYYPLCNSDLLRFKALLYISNIYNCQRSPKLWEKIDNDFNNLSKEPPESLFDIECTYTLKKARYLILSKKLESVNDLLNNVSEKLKLKQYTKNSFSFVSIEIEILWSRAQLALAQSNFYEFTFYIESTLENCQQALRCKTGSPLKLINSHFLTLEIYLWTFKIFNKLTLHFEKDNNEYLYVYFLECMKFSLGLRIFFGLIYMTNNIITNESTPKKYSLILNIIDKIISLENLDETLESLKSDFFNTFENKEINPDLTNILFKEEQKLIKRKLQIPNLFLSIFHDNKNFYIPAIFRKKCIALAITIAQMNSYGNFTTVIEFYELALFLNHYNNKYDLDLNKYLQKKVEKLTNSEMDPILLVQSSDLLIRLSFKDFLSRFCSKYPIKIPSKEITNSKNIKSEIYLIERLLILFTQQIVSKHNHPETKLKNTKKVSNEKIKKKETETEDEFPEVIECSPQASTKKTRLRSTVTASYKLRANFSPKNETKTKVRKCKAK